MKTTLTKRIPEQMLNKASLTTPRPKFFRRMYEAAKKPLLYAGLTGVGLLALANISKGQNIAYNDGKPKANTTITAPAPNLNGGLKKSNEGPVVEGKKTFEITKIEDGKIYLDSMKVNEKDIYRTVLDISKSLEMLGNTNATLADIAKITYADFGSEGYGAALIFREDSKKILVIIPIDPEKNNGMPAKIFVFK